MQRLQNILLFVPVLAICVSCSGLSEELMQQTAQLEEDLGVLEQKLDEHASLIYDVRELYNDSVEVADALVAEAAQNQSLAPVAQKAQDISNGLSFVFQQMSTLSETREFAGYLRRQASTARNTATASSGRGRGTLAPISPRTA